MRILIKVTKEVLAQSMNCGKNCILIAENCAISKAIQKFLPRAKTEDYAIYPFWINEYDTALKEIQIPIPSVATQFIRLFDCSTPEERVDIPEFSFEIDVPDSVIDKIGIEEAKEIISKSSTLELVS